MASLKPCPVRGGIPLVTVLCALPVLLLSPGLKAQNRSAATREPVQVHQTIRVVPVRQESAHITSVIPAVRGLGGPAERQEPRTIARSFPRGHSHEDGGSRSQGAFSVGCAPGMTAQQLLNPVPPNGFNYQYLNAINSDLNLKAAIDPATQLALSQAVRYGCGGVGLGGGYILWDGGGYAIPQGEQVQESPAAQPQVIVVQVPAAAEPSANKSPLPVPVQAQEQQEAAPALPDIGQFVLVARDGTQVQASAFTRSNDEIVYITPDGLRHTMPVSDLDTGATLRLNSERGSQLQLSL
jgi:hypothetical protein